MALSLNDKIQVILGKVIFPGAMVVDSFMFNSTVMDFAVVVNDQLFEVRYVENKEEFVREFTKIIRLGKITMNKHAAIAKGKFVDNRFYFLCPSRVLTVLDVPEYCGLITYITRADDDVEVSIKKEATHLHPTYLSPHFYKTLSQRLMDRIISQRNLLSITSPAHETDMPSNNNATDSRKSHTERRKNISHPRSNSKARRVKKKAKA